MDRPSNCFNLNSSRFKEDFHFIELKMNSESIDVILAADWWNFDQSETARTPTRIHRYHQVIRIRMMERDEFEPLVVLQFSPSTPATTKTWLVERITARHDDDEGAELLARFENEPDNRVRLLSFLRPSLIDLPLEE